MDPNYNNFKLGDIVLIAGYSYFYPRMVYKVTKNSIQLYDFRQAIKLLKGESAYKEYINTGNTSNRKRVVKVSFDIIRELNHLNNNEEDTNELEKLIKEKCL
jgi:hypothetical protein